MEIIIKYRAIDGKEFLSEEDCVDHENAIKEISLIMVELVPRPSDISFANGTGYIQHQAGDALRARRKLLEFAAKRVSHHWIQESLDNENIHPSYAARIIGEIGIKKLEKAWNRFKCMTTDFREFGQPYFRDNPEQAKNFRINE